MWYQRMLLIALGLTVVVVTGCFDGMATTPADGSVVVPTYPPKTARWSTITGLDSQAVSSGVLLDEYDAGEASAYRWIAMGFFYDKYPLLVRSADHSPPADPDIYTRAKVLHLFRWNGMHDKALDDYDNADSVAYRWRAMGYFYQRIGKLCPRATRRRSPSCD